jgi:PQQ-dependent dehydrogenase (methanol/ethanol family)
VLAVAVTAAVAVVAVRHGAAADAAAPHPTVPSTTLPSTAAASAQRAEAPRATRQLAAATAGPADVPAADWLGFGRTPDQNRHTPLTSITPANVSQLQRVYTVDFRAIDSTIKNGEQSYPLEVNGVLYLTTNDGNVWAVQATTGKVLWRFQPANVALFKNFGIVANRGVAYCDGKLFLTTLDMHIDAISPRNGHLIKRVAISAAVPGAASNLGYSETSAPMCANHVLVVGAAGSEYGVRGFVMGYHTDLTPAWANPYWTIPPEQTEWRKKSRLAGGGVNWTPQTIDTSTNTLYFGTGSATPLYYPTLRPGLNPRTDSLIALDLQTGQQKWWQQQMAFNEWSYDTAQPPMVYDAKIGGKVRRIVSVATMEGVWFAYDAATGTPIYQRVKVIDRTEHPALRPGQPVVVYPSSLGGVNYSPASYDPDTGYVINAAAETAAVEEQATLTPTQLAQKLIGDVFLGLANGNFGTLLPGWHDHGSISAIDVATGRRVWKFTTPEPERGGVTTTASGLGFAGGGDGVIRAFATKTGKVLWTFKAGNPIASGPTIFAEGGKEYVAITVGGTPTSSNGGTAAQLMVFSLGGTAQHDRRIVARAPAATASGGAPLAAGSEGGAARSTLGARAADASLAAARIVLDANQITVRGWTPSSNDTVAVHGRLTLNGRPVTGARIRVDSYVLPGTTDANGGFQYPADYTLARRHLVAVVGARSARVGGTALTASQQRAVLRAGSAFSVAYKVSGLRARIGKGGNVILTGHLANTTGIAPPTVVLYTYQLTGRITDAGGKPVAGAFVVTRTQDRNFWTFSQPSNADGQFRSYYTASDQAGKDPVPLSMQVTLGKVAYGLPVGITVSFKALQSANVNLQLPASPGNPVASPPTVTRGAIYQGLLVGVQGPKGTIVPVGGNWPDRNGNFRLVLPPSARGTTVSVFQDARQFFATTASPGGPVVASAWPHGLAQTVPQRLAAITLPR